ADVVAGNIVSADAAEQLIAAGADGLRVGLGPGSICTTRIITGIGVPQLTAVSEVADVAFQHKIPVIADGGIKYSGDLAKALAAGASVGMLGNVLAGTDEAPGEIVEKDGVKYKKYRGMGSVESLKANYANRYDAFKKSLVPEGVSGLTKYRGPVQDVITQFEGGLRKAMVYVGAKNLDEFQKKARFVRITSSGFSESHPHSLLGIEDTSNYEARR
ncbi:MAG: IMP dehydrogenase, partial [Candidatus Micrarchaeota archaeon]|nr:IMP dehydrogenase [Candidatus Micrarchaeota archaeon]